MISGVPVLTTILLAGNRRERESERAKTKCWKVTLIPLDLIDCPSLPGKLWNKRLFLFDHNREDLEDENG